MPEKPSSRKERITLTPEERHYFIKLKKLKQAQQLEAFKATRFYKNTSYINIVLIAIVTYFTLSVLVLCHWEQQTIKKVAYTYGEYNKDFQKQSIVEVEVQTLSNNIFQIKTRLLFQEPAINETIYLGKDWLFGKTIKAKFAYDDRAFWLSKTYPCFVLCFFALLISLYVYRANLHLTQNGLLTTLGLLFLSALYFVCV